MLVCVMDQIVDKLANIKHCNNLIWGAAQHNCNHAPQSYCDNCHSASARRASAAVPALVMMKNGKGTAAASTDQSITPLMTWKASSDHSSSAHAADNDPEFEFCTTKYYNYMSTVRSNSTNLDSKHARKNEAKSSSEHSSTYRAAPALRGDVGDDDDDAISAADELFFKGRLLPLEPHWRMHLLERLMGTTAGIADHNSCHGLVTEEGLLTPQGESLLASYQLDPSLNYDHKKQEIRSKQQQTITNADHVSPQIMMISQGKPIFAHDSERSSSASTRDNIHNHAGGNAATNKKHPIWNWRSLISGVVTKVSKLLIFNDMSYGSLKYGEGHNHNMHYKELQQPDRIRQQAAVMQQMQDQQGAISRSSIDSCDHPSCTSMADSSLALNNYSLHAVDQENAQYAGSSCEHEQYNIASRYEGGKGDAYNHDRQVESCRMTARRSGHERLKPAHNYNHNLGIRPQLNPSGTPAASCKPKAKAGSAKLINPFGGPRMMNHNHRKINDPFRIKPAGIHQPALGAAAYNYYNGRVSPFTNINAHALKCANPAYRVGFVC